MRSLQINERFAGGRLVFDFLFFLWGLYHGKTLHRDW